MPFTIVAVCDATAAEQGSIAGKKNSFSFLRRKNYQPVYATGKILL